MPKPTTPLKALADREGFDLESLKVITGYKQANVYKALRTDSPKGWLAFAIEVDRLHRITRQVVEAENELLRAKLTKLEEKHGA